MSWLALGLQGFGSWLWAWLILGFGHKNRFLEIEGPPFRGLLFLRNLFREAEGYRAQTKHGQPCN